MVTTNLHAGQFIGYLQLCRRVRGNKWRVKCTACSANPEFTVPQNYLTRKNPKYHCGCRNKSIKTLYNREYRIWLMIRVRTTDPRHVAFEHYGKRGITMCPEWFTTDKGFEQFLEHIGPAPSSKHSVDRIDNDKGYFPGNVRWATAKEQRANQRPYVNRAKPKTTE